ncbi:MAG: hypothetical protein IRY91_07760, partial [Gemmatimonadaceae bacterium]|nr:hypothetical protein [Gemmatimonadaceae bacterium]
MDDRTPWSLLARYGGDDLTPAESARLEAWSANDPANARVVRGVRWMVSALRELDDARAMDAVWDRVRSRLDHDARPGPTVVPLPTRASRPVFHALERPRSRGQVGVGIAAALVVAAGLWA